MALKNDAALSLIGIGRDSSRGASDGSHTVHACIGRDNIISMSWSWWYDSWLSIHPSIEVEVACENGREKDCTKEEFKIQGMGKSMSYPRSHSNGTLNGYY